MHWFLIDAMCIDFLLIHEFDIEHGQFILPFVTVDFKAQISFSTLTSSSCHSARRACPELQNPLYQKAKENLLPGEKVPIRADEGWGNCSCKALTHRLRRSPFSRRARVIVWMMDSATPHSMTALVEMSENQMKIKGGFNPLLVE